VIAKYGHGLNMKVCNIIVVEYRGYPKRRSARLSMWRMAEQSHQLAIVEARLYCILVDARSGKLTAADHKPIANHLRKQRPKPV